MSVPAHHRAASGCPAHLTIVEARRSSAAEIAHLEPFAVEVQRRAHVTIVQPRGELDLATVETLRSTLDALDQRARGDGFQLTLLAPMDAVDIEPANPHPRLVEASVEDVA